MSPLIPRVMLVAVLSLVVAACTIEPPFARVNPFDSDGDLPLWVEGPDSTHAVNERFTVRLASDRELPDDMFFRWATDRPNSVVGGGGGEFVVLHASTAYQRVQVFAELGDRVVAKTIYVGVRAP